MVTLSDGMSLRFVKADESRYKICVDIDGPNKGKNQVGNDIFDFTIYINQNTASSYDTKINQLIPSFSATPTTGRLESTDYFITAWVVEIGNIDYLKASNDGNYLKCSNGVLLDWTTNTSCH